MAIRKYPVSPEPLVVRIEKMKRTHLRSVVRIEKSVYVRPWSASLFAQELVQTRDRRYLVAKVGRRVVGYAGALMQADATHVSTIGIDPMWQRMGIATRLMVSLSQYAVDHGATGITLEVRMSNTAAQELYRKFGFKIEGVRKGYYQAEGEDGIVMWAHDISGPDFVSVLEYYQTKYADTTEIEIQ